MVELMQVWSCNKPRSIIIKLPQITTVFVYICRWIKMQFFFFVCQGTGSSHLHRHTYFTEPLSESSETSLYYIRPSCAFGGGVMCWRGSFRTTDDNGMKRTCWGWWVKMWNEKREKKKCEKNCVWFCGPFGHEIVRFTRVDYKNFYFYFYFL